MVTKPILSTHRRGRPRICVVGHQAHIQSHVYTSSNVAFTSPSFTHPRIGVEDPRICVESTLAASNITRPTHRTSPSLSQPRIGVEAHEYAWEANSSRLKLTLEELNVTPSLLAHSRATHMRRTASICVEGKLNVQVLQDPRIYALKQADAWKMFKPSLSYEDPRIGVEVHAYAWKHAEVALKISKSHAYAWSPTHMRGKHSKTGQN
ncbi:hypothetical protein PIB30_094607, partial [Stylosanthes scabra]|nr:hypothetical protein [Stylosanthes scabra]